MPKKIVFLCTGNSARSQMAEGFARTLAGAKWDVYSAGTAPAGLNPLAVKAMAEAGVDISGHTSKTLDPQLLASADVVVTLCGDAAESCPLTPPEVKRIHWALPDPVKATGTPEDIMTTFRAIRDEIKDRVKTLLETEE
ncbi:MAG: arsenate reductase (thioredoxin) [Peptococcaceae bacterium]|nr:arsenate reductase (thioredoxin) [Peptococcaceae bacterium]